MARHPAALAAMVGAYNPILVEIVRFSVTVIK